MVGAAREQHGCSGGTRPGPGQARGGAHGAELRVADGGVSLFDVDLVQVLRISRQQSLVGQDVDAPGQAFRGPGNALYREGREQIGAFVTGGAQTETEVGADIAFAQGRQGEVVGDPFLERAHRILGQARVEFGLAEQGNVQELVPARFEVGEQADFLERFGGHGVCLVDHDHDGSTGGVELDQARLQGAQEQVVALFGQRGAELVGDRMADFLAVERRVGEIDGFDFRRQAFEEHTTEHGLAAADLAAHLDDAFIVGDGVDQGFQGGAAVGAAEEELGVRGDPERRFLEPEMVEIHHVSLAVVSIRWYSVVRLMPSRRAAWLTLPWARRSAASM